MTTITRRYNYVRFTVFGQPRTLILCSTCGCPPLDCDCYGTPEPDEPEPAPRYIRRDVDDYIEISADPFDDRRADDARGDR